MSEAAAPAQPATESAPAPERQATPVEHKGEPGTTLNRVKALRDQLSARREQRMFGGSKPKDAPAKADEKPAAKAEPEKPAERRDAKPEKAAEAKNTPADGPARDESGRFKSAEGDAKPTDKPRPKDTPAEDNEPPPAAAKGAADAQDEPAAREPAKPELKAEKPPEKREDTRLARTLLELRDAKAEALELGKRAKRTEELEGLLKRAKVAEGGTHDDELFEQLHGMTFVDYVKLHAAGKLKFVAKSPLSPELRALQARLDAVESERAQERERVQRTEAEKQGTAARSKELGMVKEWLPEVAERFPYLSSLDDAADQVLDSFYAAWPRDDKGRFKPAAKPDIEDVAEEIEGHLSKRFTTAATSKRAMMALLKDPKSRDLAIEILGLQKQTTDTQTRETNSPQREEKGNHQSAPAEGPRTLSNKVTQDVPAYVKKQLDEEQERNALHERFRAFARRREAARQ